MTEEKILTPDTELKPEPEPAPKTGTEEGLVEAKVDFLSTDQRVQLGPEISFEEGLILQSLDGSFVISFPLDSAARKGDGQEALEHLRRQIAAQWSGARKGSSPCRLRLVISCEDHGIHGSWEVNLGFAPEAS